MGYNGDKTMDVVEVNFDWTFFGLLLLVVSVRR